MKHKTNNAEAAFRKRQISIAERIERIQSKLSDYGKNDKINWAHVGSLAHVDELLEEIDEFLG